MRTIAVINQKGGCGKTTTAINLAASLAEVGRRVLLVDLDPQGHATLGLSIRGEDVRRTMYEVLLGDWVEGGVRLSEVVLTLSGNLHLAPANIMLSAIEQQLAGVDGREDRLRDALAEVSLRYDYAIIDSPPNVGLLTFNALRAADEVLVPVETGFFSLHGLTKLLETVAVVNSEYGQDAAVRILPTMYETRHRIDREVLAELRRHFGDRLARTVIRMNVRLREAASFGLPITEFDPRSIGARDYLALALEVAQAEVEPASPLPGVPPGPAEQHTADPSPITLPTALHLPENTDEVVIGAADTTTPTDEGSAEGAVPAVEGIEETPETEAGGEADLPTAVPQWTVVHPDTAGADESGSAQEPPPESEGTGVVFTIYAPEAGEVKVAGDFNNWTPERLEPSREKDLWQRTLPLPAGRYRYRFVIDNNWCPDPNNPEVEDCPFGGYNSVLTVA